MSNFDVFMVAIKIESERMKPGCDIFLRSVGLITEGKHRVSKIYEQTLVVESMVLDVVYRSDMQKVTSEWYRLFQENALQVINAQTLKNNITGYADLLLEIFKEGVTTTEEYVIAFKRIETFYKMFNNTFKLIQDGNSKSLKNYDKLVLIMNK